MLRNKFSHTWEWELLQANAMLSFRNFPWSQSTRTSRPKPSIMLHMYGLTFWILMGGVAISECQSTWHSSMHTKGLLPAGDRPQLRRVSLTLENLNFTYIAAVQFMGGWHWHFTSLDAKNSTDMIKIVGLSSSSLSKSPGPTWQDNFLLPGDEKVKYICISSTSLESKADIPNLSHSAFSCWAIVVRGTNIEVVERGVKWTSYWSHKN